jgi:RimJ/RimL family protein N-acetyltransferase
MLVVGIEERPGGTVIGNARLHLLPRRRARFSILIGEADHRGSGQGREATALLCRYAFERLAVDEIMLEVDPRNVPAVRAYEAVGFRHGRGQTMRLRRASR